MREIKFRVWDNLEKAYLKEEDIGIDSLGNVFIFEGYDNNDADLWYARILLDPDNERYVIEQATGMKDENGNEIFVNDIVEMHYFEQYAGPGEVEKTVMGVVGKDSIGCFTRVGDKKYYWLHYLEDAEYYGDTKYNEELELLGNIHENPELLEKK